MRRPATDQARDRLGGRVACAGGSSRAKHSSYRSAASGRKASTSAGSRWVPRRLASSRMTSLERPGVLVGPRREQRVEHVADRADPRGQRDLVALQALRVAGAVPSLVVAERDLLGHLHERGLRAGQDAGPDRRVGLHLRPLGRVELGWLQQDLVRDRRPCRRRGARSRGAAGRPRRRSARPRVRAARTAGPSARCARRSRRRATPPRRPAGGRSRARRRRGRRCARARAARAARCRGSRDSARGARRTRSRRSRRTRRG